MTRPALMRMAHASDPKQELIDKVGDISGMELFHNNILVATYVRPNVTAGGVHLPDGVRNEDMYQGKVGVVIAKGPTAFVDDKDVQFHGQNIELGEWIYYRAADGWQMTVNGQHCRLLQDTQIRGRLASPDIVY